jgi:hypothetical protein
MARLRPTRAVRVLTVEEKKRVANFFMLLVEINLQKDVISKRRSLNSTKEKVLPSNIQKKKKKPINKISYSKSSRSRNSLGSARRDLYLKPFNRILVAISPIHHGISQ